MCVCVCVCVCVCFVIHSVLLGTVTEDLGQPIALVEDMALRGFAPLVRSQESLQFTMKLKLTNVQQVRPM